MANAVRNLRFWNLQTNETQLLKFIFMRPCDYRDHGAECFAKHEKKKNHRTECYLTETQFLGERRVFLSAENTPSGLLNVWDYQHFTP